MGKQVNKEMLNRIEAVDKLTQEERKIIPHTLMLSILN